MQNIEANVVQHLQRSKTVIKVWYRKAGIAFYQIKHLYCSLFSVMCHGLPTLENIVFLYDSEGVPVDAKVTFYIYVFIIQVIFTHFLLVCQF